jgi:hypothetical protein
MRQEINMSALDFTVKLGFFNLMSADHSKEIDIKFDGKTVATCTVTSADRFNPDWAEFTVNKAPAIYDMAISVVSGMYDSTSIGIAELLVKSNATSFYDVRACGFRNTDRSVVFIADNAGDNADNTNFPTARSPSGSLPETPVLKALWFDQPTIAKIEIVDITIEPDWPAFGRYRFDSFGSREDHLADLIANPSKARKPATEEVISEWQTNLDTTKAWRAFYEDTTIRS